MVSTLRRYSHHGQLLVLSALFVSALTVLICTVLRLVALELPGSLDLAGTADALTLAMQSFTILLPAAALLTALNLSFAALEQRTPKVKRQLPR